MSDFNVEDQAGLAALIEGKSDEEINAVLSAAGPETVVDQVMDAMQTRFQPDAAAGQSAIIQWDIAGPDGTISRQVRVADGACTVAKDTNEAARVTLALSQPDFLRFISGQLDGMQAFMSGKLKISGDLMFAQTMQTWFAQ